MCHLSTNQSGGRDFTRKGTRKQSPMDYWVRQSEQRTLRFARNTLSDVVLVSDESMKAAVKSLLFDSHILAEPSGAAPVAALLSGAYKPKSGEKIGLVISGGNIAYTLLQDLLNETYPNRC